MNKKTIISIGSSALILTLCVSSYLFFQSKPSKENDTICKTNTKSSEKPSANASSPSSSEPNNGQTSQTGSSSNNTTINTVGNTNINLLNHGALAQQDKWVFYNYNGLCKSMLDMKFGFKRLNYDNADNINVVGKWVYYTYRNTLFKVSTEGGTKIKLSEEKVFRMIVSGESIYYTDCLYNKIFKINLDGKNKVEISSDPCNSFSLAEDWIYYCSSNDPASKIYKIKTDGTNKTEVVNTKCFGPVIDSDYLCYIANPMDDYKIVRMKLDGSEKKEFNTPILMNYVFHKNFFYYIDSSGKLYKINIDNNKQELLVDLSKHAFTAIASLNFINDDLFFLSNNTDIFKISEDGTVEKIKN